MADKQPFAGLSTEDVGVAILGELRTLNARFPMKDTADAMRVSGTVTANPASGTITTVSTLTNAAQIGAAPANSTVGDLMNIAAARIYDQLVVS